MAGQLTLTLRPVWTHPSNTDSVVVCAAGSLTVTRTSTVPTPCSSIRKLTRGGLPALAVLGTLSCVITGCC